MNIYSTVHQERVVQRYRYKETEAEAELLYRKKIV